MKLTRIKAYLNNQFTGFEIVYYTDYHAKAIQQFKKEFPNINDCILIASSLDTENERENNFILTAVKCGAFRGISK